MLGLVRTLQRLKDICLKVLSIVTELIHKLHLKTIGAYLINLTTQYALLIGNLLVQTWLKIKPQLVRYLIIAVLLTKAGIILALQTLGQLGQKLVTIARKTLQRVKPAQKQDN